MMNSSRSIFWNKEFQARLDKALPDSRINFSVYREQLFTVIGWTKAYLYWQFLKHGWLLRRRRFASQY